MSSKHKRQDSGTQPPCPWTALQKPPFSGTTAPGGGGGSRSRGGQKGDTCGPLLGSPIGSDAAEVLTPSVLEGTLKYRGVKVRVKSSHTGISWKPASGALPWCLELSVLTAKIPYDEVLGAWATSTQITCSCVCRKEHAVVVAALLRPRRNPNAWKVEEHRLVAGSLEQAKEWVAAIQSALQLCYDRPRNLLVFINPFSGSKRARQVWAYDAAPVFVKAGIKFTVIETLAADHACSTLASMKADELAMYQGVVAVGGDGVFQECVMGVVAQRARGGKNAAAAARLRLGHIPGGSTDAVAYTLHGTRSAEAAALHIALGDRLPLDVARVDCIDPDHFLPPPPAPAAQQPTSTWAQDAVLLPTGGGDGPLTPAGGAGARLLPSMPSGGSADGQNNNSSTRGARASEGVSRSGTRGGEPLTTTDPRAALVCPLTHSHSSSFSTSAPISGGSPTAARMGPRAASTGFVVADTVDPWLGGNGDRGGSVEARPVTTGPAPLMTKHFVCQAAYGFLGDVMHFSEGLRCLGPSRYDVSGFVQFLRLRSYPLLISYRPAPVVRNSTTNGMAPEPASSPCTYPCEVCRMAGINLARVSADDDPWSVPPQSYGSPGPHSHSHQHQAPPGSPPDTSAPVSSSSLTTSKAHQPAPTSSSSLPGTYNQRPTSQPPAASHLPPAASGAANTSNEQLLTPSGASGELQGHGGSPAAGAAAADGGGCDGGWVTVQGEYISVMCVVTPCRSDKSTQGILPHAHLSDGRMYLVMVSKCGRLDYLRFLLRLSSRGLQDGCFPFVKIVPITALSMRPSGGASGKESCWNVDGELLPTNNVRARIQRGMVDVFARGVE